MLMGLALGSTSFVEAYGNTYKYDSKDNKMSGKELMHSIEKDLKKIKHRFEENHNVQVANRKLDLIPERIKTCAMKFKREERRDGAHIRLWQTHKHTLQRELRDVREYVEKHTKHRN